MRATIGDRSLAAMSGLPLLCLLIALPFLSTTVIAMVPGLRCLSARYPRITWPVGAAGLALLLAGLVGALPAGQAVPLMLAGGAVSGFSMFWSAHEAGDGEDWRGPRDDPEEPPPGPLDDGPDWQLFDYLRAEWERMGVRSPRSGEDYEPV